MIKSLTVVIPTFNRASVLKKALDAYSVQSAQNGISEILVVDDGSTDETPAIVTEVAQRTPFPIRHLRQENKGPAAARNWGIRSAAGEIILFTDDDVVPGPTLVEEHLEWHKNNSQLCTGVLGYVTWPLEMRATPFMCWYGEHGPLFAYSKFRGKLEIDYRYFYSCNISLKTEFLRMAGRFDEDFKTAAYEDVELGYRLSKAGLRLLYNPGAIAHHHQHFSFAEACLKAKRSEAAREIFLQKEAGKAYLDQERKRSNYAGEKLLKSIAAKVGSILLPFERFLDSRMPLPPIIYHFFFWSRVTRLRASG